MAGIRCIGVILDGNRRWARARGYPAARGHQEGYERLKDAARWVRDREIPHMVVYAFSTENWHRSDAEVAELMSLFRAAVGDLHAESQKERIALKFVGERERFAPDLQEKMREIEKQNPQDAAMVLWICLSYGGRAEIVAAARAAASLGDITEATLSGELWTSGMPDPDIVIRTGGAHRVSNFLLWQIAYTELFFLDDFWPDFTAEMLDKVLEDYEGRERRMGV